MAAIRRGAEADVRLLLRARAQVSRTSADAKTCLQIAADQAQPQILDAVLEHVAAHRPRDLCLNKNAKGETFFQKACARGDAMVVRKFAASGGATPWCDAMVRRHAAGDRRQGTHRVASGRYKPACNL